MKILFVLSGPTAWPAFDPVIQVLSERGHTVYLTFDTAEMVDSVLDTVPVEYGPIQVLGQFPERGDDWQVIARGLRSITDYLRYLDPQFVNAWYLRDRVAQPLLDAAPIFRWLRKLPAFPRPVVQGILRGMRFLEAAIPGYDSLNSFLEALDLDLVVVSPLSGLASRQTDVVKAAKALGIPVCLGLDRGDSLTATGFIHSPPDKVLVWNELQQQEAQTLHLIPAEQVIVTGAPVFDQWFNRRPTVAKRTFCQQVGLSSERPFLLFVGSAANPLQPTAEPQFVREWIQAIRASEDARLREVGILIRPHPLNASVWQDFDLAPFDNVALWPHPGTQSQQGRDRADYFHSLYFSSVVMGIHTTAMLEAAIVGRPVQTILLSEFNALQQGMVQFRYLMDGLVSSAITMDEHLRQLSAALAAGHPMGLQPTEFVHRFIRPHGLEQPCAPIVADELEKIGRIGALPQSTPTLLYPVRWGLAGLGPIIFRPVREDRQAIAVQAERPAQASEKQEQPLLGKR